MARLSREAQQLKREMEQMLKMPKDRPVTLDKGHGPPDYSPFQKRKKKN